MKERFGWIGGPASSVAMVVAGVVAWARWPEAAPKPVVGGDQGWIYRQATGDRLSSFLVGRGWQEPPGPGDLSTLIRVPIPIPVPVATRGPAAVASRRLGPGRGGPARE